MDMGVYANLRGLHIALVLISGGLFAVRGVAVLAGRTWPMRPAVRRLSYGIDTLLLCAGVALWFMLGLNPWRDDWLGVKLLCLLVYIVLGSLALKRARTQRGRWIGFLAALGAFGFMLSVARTHHPAGLFTWL